MKSRILIIVAIGLFVAMVLGVLIYTLVGGSGSTEPEATTASTAPSETTLPPETSLPPETTAAPTEPQPEEFTLTFAGDCTFAMSGFVNAVGEDYTYPFKDVQPYFGSDDCTFINLECALSDRGAKANKLFTFRGSPAYINILTQGSVEFASVVNNHSMDYGQVAYDDTRALLDEAGVHYAEDQKTTLFETQRGLKIGVLALYFPSATDGIADHIKSLREQGAEIVVVCVHWGEEYHFKPNGVQMNVGRFAIDNGADIVYGQHPHVLQPVEEYNGGVIYYSLANFSFGGNPMPGDMDTAILQQKVVREPDGTVHLGELNIVPCYVSGIPETGNDYQPMPMDPEADSVAYDRVLRKLSGEYELDKLYVSYRDDLNDPTGGDTGETDATTPPAGEGSGETTPPAGGSEEVAPPAGGGEASDGTGEVTPPAGGTEGGGSTPPADGGGSSGDTPPVQEQPPASGGES